MWIYVHVFVCNLLIYVHMDASISVFMYICVCMLYIYVWMYVCTVCMYNIQFMSVRINFTTFSQYDVTYFCIFFIYICFNACKYACMYACMHVCSSCLNLKHDMNKMCIIYTWNALLWNLELTFSFCSMASFMGFHCGRRA